MTMIESCITPQISFIKLPVLSDYCAPASTVLATKISVQKVFPSYNRSLALANKAN